MVAMLGFPCALRTTSSGSNPCVRAQLAQTRETAGVESTSTPSKSNKTPRHRIEFTRTSFMDLARLSAHHPGLSENLRDRKTLGWEMGFEPTTFGAKVRRSTS